MAVMPTGILTSPQQYSLDLGWESVHVHTPEDRDLIWLPAHHNARNNIHYDQWYQ